MSPGRPPWIIQLATAIDVHRELTDLVEAAHDVLDGAGKHVDAAHDHHVVDATDHAALEDVLAADPATLRAQVAALLDREQRRNMRKAA